MLVEFLVVKLGNSRPLVFSAGEAPSPASFAISAFLLNKMPLPGAWRPMKPAGHLDEEGAWCEATVTEGVMRAMSEVDA